MPHTFLHVGCGPKRKDQTTRAFCTDEWLELRFDIDESVNPDLIGTMTDMSAVARGNLFMAHRCGFTQKVLTGTLKAAGFKVMASIARPAAFDLWALASKSARSEEEMRKLAAVHFPG